MQRAPQCGRGRKTQVVSCGFFHAQELADTDDAKVVKMGEIRSLSRFV